jgi:hypothetical protein
MRKRSNIAFGSNLRISCSPASYNGRCFRVKGLLRIGLTPPFSYRARDAGTSHTPSQTTNRCFVAQRTIRPTDMNCINRALTNENSQNSRTRCKFKCRWARDFLAQNPCEENRQRYVRLVSRQYHFFYTVFYLRYCFFDQKRDSLDSNEFWLL